MKRVFIKWFAVLSASATLALPSQAGLILQAAGVTAESESGTAVAVNMINQSGLSAGYTSLVTDFDSYLASTTHDSNGSTVWADVPPTSVVQNVDFDLGGSYSLESLGLWNWYSGDSRALQAFNLYAADNSSFTGASLLGNYSAAEDSSLATVAGQVFSFSPTTASHMRIEILSNYGSTSQVVISEVAFETSTATTPVPNPATLTLFGLGLAGLGWSRRNKV